MKLRTIILRLCVCVGGRGVGTVLKRRITYPNQCDSLCAQLFAQNVLLLGKCKEADDIFTSFKNLVDCITV